MESTSNQFINSINPEEPEDVQEDLEKERSLEQGGTWAKGASEEDNRRYKAFLAYMEEKREESRRILREGEEKKRKGREKEARWDLMKEAVKFLKENSDSWRERRIEECERIRLEEKEDRFAVIRMKKKRYGLTTLSKEERMRLKGRTEEKLLLAKTKSNLWKMARDPAKNDLKEGEAEAWSKLGEGAEEFMEEAWIRKYKEFKEEGSRERKKKEIDVGEKKKEIDTEKLREEEGGRRMVEEEKEKGDKGSTEQVDLTEGVGSILKGEIKTTSSEKFISTLAKTTAKTVSVKRMVAALEGTDQELNPVSRYNFAGLEGPAQGSPAKRRRTWQQVPPSPSTPGPRTLGGTPSSSAGYATATSSSPGPRWRRPRGSTGARTPRKGGCPSPRPVSTLTKGTGSSLRRLPPATPCPGQILAKKLLPSQTEKGSPEKVSLCQEQGPTLAPTGRTFSVLNTRTLSVKPVQGGHIARAGRALGAVHHQHQPDHLLLHQGGHQYGSACPPEVMTGTSASSSQTSWRQNSSEKGGVLELRRKFIEAGSEQSQTPLSSSSSSTTMQTTHSCSDLSTLSSRRLPTAAGRGTMCTSTSTPWSSTQTTGRQSSSSTGTNIPTATPRPSSWSPPSILSIQASSLPWGQEPGARPWPTGTRGVCPSSPSSLELMRSERSPGRSGSLDIISEGGGGQIRGQMEQNIVSLYEQQARYPAQLPLTDFCSANSNVGGGKTTDPLLISTETERTNERADRVTDRGGGQGLVENNIFTLSTKSQGTITRPISSPEPENFIVG